MTGSGLPAEVEEAIRRAAGDAAPDRIEDRYSDRAHAARLHQLHGARLRYVEKWGRWIVNEADGFWSSDFRDVRVRELATDVGRILQDEGAPPKKVDEALQLGAIRAMVDLARGLSGILLDHEQLDADPWLLGTQNGVLDLRTGELRQARPADLITRRCPVVWEPDAKAPRWRQALAEWFPDEDVRDYFQRLAGAALLGRQRDHIFAIHYGPGGNGKGTAMRALQHVLGPYAVVINHSLLVNGREEHATVRADLFRARLAVAVETEARHQLRESSVKNLTGGDRITARRMREDPWEFDPSHSLWLQTNYLPEIAGRDEGIWRRIKVVPWTASFTSAPDPSLDDHLRAEASGILRWAVLGCIDYQREGLEEPEAVKRATLDYRGREDRYGRFAKDTGLVVRADLEIPAKEIQSMLAAWAEENGVNAPAKEFTGWLRDRGVKPGKALDDDKKQYRTWQGIGLDDEDHEAAQTEALL